MINLSKADISETVMLEAFGQKVFSWLLYDHTTHGNIIWATADYSALGEGFGEKDQITIEKITGEHERLIVPRAVKSKELQKQRTQVKAEVFTPSWVCNLQNNLLDENWFGRKNVFNTSPDERSWVGTAEPIAWPEGKSWQEYVADTRLEITCGEAPYIVSRYDATTGRFIPTDQRVGLLDRKLRVVSERCHDERQWLQFAGKALQNVLGFEWQGDSLLLARENVLVTMIEYYKAKFGEGRMPERGVLAAWAETVSWNFWQMDGLTSQLPYAPKREYRHRSLFEEDNETFCKIMDWDEGEVIYFESLKKQYRDK